MNFKYAILIAFLAMLTLPATSMAAAPYPCDQAIFDNTGKLDAAKSDIQAQVDAMKADNIDPHIILVKTTKGAGADQVPDRMLAECENWQSADGSLAPKLLALVVSVDEKRTHTRYGTALRRELDSEYLSIQETVMAPYFRSGDFGQGIAEGLNAFHDEITTPGTSSSSNDSNDNNNNNREPVEFNGPSSRSVLIFFLSVAGLGLLGFASFLTVGAVKERNRREEEQARAIKKRQELVSLTSTLQSKLNDIRNRSVVVMDKTWEGEDQEIEGLLATVEQNMAASEDMMLAINEKAELDPTKEFKKTSDYEKITKQNNRLEEQLTLTSTSIDTLNTALQTFEDMVVQTPAVLAEYNSLVIEATTALTERKAEGYQITTGENLLAAASGSAKSAETLESKGRVKDSFKAATEARDGAQAARKWAEELPATAARLPREAQDLLTQIDDAKRSGKKTAGDWDVIQNTYHQNCWADLKDYTPTSERSLRELENLQREATTCATMQEQRFGDAERCIGQARTQLRDLGELQVQVASRREHLDKLAQVLPTEANSLQLEAGNLVEYIQDNMDDLTQSQLDSASDLQSNAENLVTATTQTKPDYLALETDLTTLAHQVSSLFTEVRERVSELKRLRDRARSLEGSVQSSYSRSNSYISSHSSKVKSTARSRYERAEREWESRGNYDPHDTASLLTYIALLESLDNDFDTSYSSAMSDVSAWDYSNPSSSSGSSWSSSGSGGGSDWGSSGFDSGGGGGSDW